MKTIVELLREKFVEFTVEELDTLIKGKPAQIGEIRTWKGVKVRKTAPGKWEPVKESQKEGGRKAEKEAKTESFSDFTGIQWANFLGHLPEFAKYCDWKKLDGHDWSVLLRKQPQLAEYCDWKKLDGWNWSTLLQEQPRLADKCDWSKLDGHDWAHLLAKQPQFASKCDWNKLKGVNWEFLLHRRPQFAKYRKEVK